MLSAEEQALVETTQAKLDTHNTFYLGSEPFSVRRFLVAGENPTDLPRFAFAEDDCGNFFVRDVVTGQVGFWVRIPAHRDRRFRANVITHSGDADH